MRATTQKRSGFTLLEAMMALFVISLALLLGYSLMMRQPRAIERLEAGDEAVRAIEASLETIRALPQRPQSRNLQPFLDYPPPTAAQNLLLDLEVAPTGIDGLFAVTVEARYRVGRAIHRRRIETLVWKP